MGVLKKSIAKAIGDGVGTAMVQAVCLGLLLGLLGQCGIYHVPEAGGRKGGGKSKNTFRVGVV